MKHAERVWTNEADREMRESWRRWSAVRRLCERSGMSDRVVIHVVHIEGSVPVPVFARIDEWWLSLAWPDIPATGWKIRLVKIVVSVLLFTIAFSVSGIVWGFYH